MADYNIDKLQGLLLAIDAALGQGDSIAPPRPELWTTLADVSSEEVAKLTLDAAAHRARGLRAQVAAARAGRAEAQRQANIFEAHIAEYERSLAEIEDNLVRPLCQGFGSGNTRQLDTGFARVALARKPGRIALSQLGRKLGEENVVAALPLELIRLPPPEPNKKAIHEAIEAGVDVPGFELVAGETRVEWRS